MWQTDNKYTVKPTSRFKQQYKKMSRSGNYNMNEIDEVINILSRGDNLPNEYFPHPLNGQLDDLWGCHIRSDWVLVYSRNDQVLVLTLYSTGKHDKGYSLH